MNLTRLIRNEVFDKCFSKMSPTLKSFLPSLLFSSSEQNDYLENLSNHADAIGWHLGKIDVLDLIQTIGHFFNLLLRKLRRLPYFDNLTIAFDETYIPYYGKDKGSSWIHGYNNNVKGATGTYKFMVVSVVANTQRFVLSSVPMATCDCSNPILNIFLSRIKKYFHVSLVLLDRGFASKELAYQMEQLEQKYIALCPKWKNVKKFLDNKLSEVIEFKKIRQHREDYVAKMHYVLEYNLYGHDWVFLTNTQIRGIDLLKAYKSRWGIETTFRVMDLADIKSKSTNIAIRSFYFFVSTVLYNIWIQIRGRLGCTFAKFLDLLALANKSLNSIIDEWIDARKQLSEFDLIWLPPH